jgi:hypothetical protein
MKQDETELSGFKKLFSESENLRCVLLITQNAMLINEVLEKIPDSVELLVVNAQKEFDQLILTKRTFDIVIVFDQLSVGRENLEAQYLMGISDLGNKIYVSFSNPTSGFSDNNKHWPSYYRSILESQGILNTSTHPRKYFWSDQNVPLNFTESLLAFSKFTQIPESDIPIDCVHPSRLIALINAEADRDSKYKLRRKLIGKVSPTTREIFKQYLPRRWVWFLRMWLRK